VVFDAQKGVEAQSETVWRQADRYGVPRLVFVNKMDVVGANFANAVDEIRERLEGRPVPVMIPIGSGSPKDSPTPFHGIIDLIEMRALFFEEKDKGKTIRVEPIHADLQEESQRWRERLFDRLTENDEHDRLTSAYLEGREINPATIRELLREQTLRRHIQPVLCGSGREHIGVQPLLDAVASYLPSPLDRPPVSGVHPRKKDKEEKRKPDPKEPFCGLVFKVVSDVHGEVCFVRIYSGTLKPQSRPLNAGKDRKELVSKLYHVYADPTKRSNLDEIPEGQTGDIVVLVSLKESITGDTLCDPHHPILLEPIQFPEGVVSRSIEPDSSADKQKLTDALDSLKKEDPTFTWRVDADTGQTLMSGMGLLHLEIKEHRLERDFHLRVRVGQPRVSYRETLKRDKEIWGECDRQIAGARLFARLHFVFKPSRGKKPIVYVNSEMPPGELTGRPEDEVVEHAIISAFQSGEFGYPVTDVEASLHNVVRHPTDTNEVALEIAAADAVNKALKDNIILLEPVMHLEVTVPEEYLGPVTADLGARRADIDQLLSRGKLRVLEARVPLRAMFDYSDKVRSLSQGRASWSMEPLAYAPAPPEVLHALLHPEDV
jgi:elongation factor G